MGPHQHFTLNMWQKQYEWADTSPQTDFRKLKDGEKDDSQIFINETEKTKTFQLEGNWRNLDGEPVTGYITLEPFTSQILIRNSLLPD
jgi:hypothetical protein